VSVSPFDLSGKVVVVTGASKGIGRELALLLAEAGGIIVPTVRTEADADQVAKDASSQGCSLHPLLLDVTNVAAIERMVAQVVERHGRIDVLVNNAGLGTGHNALKVTESDWDDMMAVNLRGLFFASQAAARAMADRGGGRIINISSQGGLVGLPNAAVYCTSKGGVNMLTKVLALEWAPLGINVNAIAPTFIRTPGTAPTLEDPKQREWVMSKIPLGKIGTTSDVAAATVYLSTEASRLVTGTVLVVDGGWTAQ